MKNTANFTEENKTLIDFTKELISQYNDSLSYELEHIRYKVNLRDSYERLVYYSNGKDALKYIKTVMINLNNVLNDDIENNKNKDTNKYVIEYIIEVLKRVNIQSEIIDDYVDFLYKQKNDEKCIYRKKYDLNIGDNRDLYFTKNCLKIDYIKLTKAISNHSKNIDDNQIDGFYMLLNDLRRIGKELDDDYIDEKVRSIGRKFI